MCVSGKVVLWPTYFFVRIGVPMSYSNFWNYIYIYIYTYCLSVPSCLSRRRRRQPLSIRPSSRPSRRRPSFVRPSRCVPSSPSSSSVRPSVPSSVPSSSYVLCPSSVRPSTSVPPSSSSVLCPSVPSSVQLLLARHRVSFVGWSQRCDGLNACATIWACIRVSKWRRIA